ncbi:hypothetical protein BZA77DRAFT_24027 [Pyronema omphalodes]|nr:hypothetical protein BZA77DRAFT_24027 [Pyronema omphalodes]
MSPNTTTTSSTSPQTAPEQPPKPPKPAGLPGLGEKLALALLEHKVKALEEEANSITNRRPPVKKIYYCVCDETVLTEDITGLQRRIDAKSIHVIVPFTTLNALDKLKKGSDSMSQMARRSIHYFDRVMQGTVKSGVTIQAPNLKYGTWAECLAAAPIAGKASLASTFYSSSDEEHEPTNKMKEILNCVIHRLNDEQLKQIGKIILVTNDRKDRDDSDMHLYEWAKSFGIPTYTTTELAKLVPLEREKNGRGRGGAEPQRTEAPVEPVQIIDPNSFCRGGNTSPRAERTPHREIFPIGNESSRREGSRRSDGFGRGAGGVPRGILFRANSSPRDASSPRTDTFRSPSILTRADSYNDRESVPRGDNNRNNYSPRGESLSSRADGFSRGSPTTRGGHTGGVARGKGKLWEP